MQPIPGLNELLSLRNDYAITACTLMLALVLALWVWVNPVIAWATLVLFVAPSIVVLLIFTGKNRNPRGRRAITVDPNTRAPLVLGGEFERSIPGTVGEKHAIALSLKKLRKGKKFNRK